MDAALIGSSAVYDVFLWGGSPRSLGLSAGRRVLSPRIIRDEVLSAR
jgi:hypothetical protein